MDDIRLLLTVLSVAFSFATSHFLLPKIIATAHRFHWFDPPEDRKIHTGLIPRLGGIAIVSSLAISAIVAPFLASRIMGKNISPFKYMIPNMILVSGGLLIFVVGLIDDFKSISAKKKLAFQIIAALLACAGGAKINFFMVPFIWYKVELGIWAWPITVFWIVAIVNALNMIDGMDGLSGTISGLACLTYGLVFMLQSNYLLSIFCFALLGSIMGFLMYNYPPAQIFMGDSGSMFLGFFLAVIPLAAEPDSGGSLVLPITMLVIPIIDVIAAIIRRGRDRVPFFEPDRSHMHHKLLRMGFDERRILSLVCLFSFFFGLCSVLTYYLSARKGLILIFINWAIGILFFIMLHYLNKFGVKKRKNT
ncbi:MAG: MraY family glycosyltransferase [Spirochaetales bacterium]|nr:MraY family glycosyltransferase [Spirochaetales bacterium]